MTSSSSSNDPEFYKRTPSERFNMNHDLEDIYRGLESGRSEEEMTVLHEWLMAIVEAEVSTPKQFEKMMIKLRKKYKRMFKKCDLLHAYNRALVAGEIKRDDTLKQLFVRKSQKSQSGVLVITVLTSPYPISNGKKQRFSCQWNCYYCPNEPGQPRSYLHDEPSVLRANRNSFDPVLQFCDRACTLELNGHPVDKIELLILGGTWASYPHDYQESFIRDLFYAANTFHVRRNKREKLSLSEEKTINESAECKIIGITLETRPDCINEDEIRRFRYYGCTRVQLGVQHTYRSVLDKINRECFTEDTIRALRLLKDNCYKIDIHLMPNLPGSNRAMDRDMFDRVINDPDLQADQWKIYPCETTPWTMIKKWFEEGSYVPYDEENLLQLLVDVKPEVHPWIRLNRVVRDIPSQYILGGVDNPSMRQLLDKMLADEGKKCRCIRCREVKGQTINVDDVELVIRAYPASGALEYFISFETKDRSKICGFARLRIPAYMCKDVSTYITETSPVMAYDVCEVVPEDAAQRDIEPTRAGRSRQRSDPQADGTEGLRRRNRSKSPFVKAKQAAAEAATSEEKPVANASGSEMIFPELMGAALVRELHVYGQLIATKDKKSKHAQHVGYGTRLMRKAEELARMHGAKRVAVISGVGVRNFYRKIGYELEGESEMMMKSLPMPVEWYHVVLALLFTVAWVVAGLCVSGGLECAAWKERMGL